MGKSLSNILYRRYAKFQRMSNISVAEILKIHGTWIQGKNFADLVSQKRRITERHAYNLITKASKKKEILRVPLSNRTVLNGLPEFGPIKRSKPTIETLNVEAAFLDRCFRNLERISEMNANGEIMKARLMIDNQIRLLPQCRGKNKLLALNQAASEDISKAKGVHALATSIKQRKLTYGWVKVLINEFSNWLHSKVEET